MVPPRNVQRLIVAAGLFALARPVAAQEADSEDAPSEAVTGSTDTYWGPVEGPTDENTKALEPVKNATWATVLDVPYEIIAIPFRIFSFGVRWSVDIPGQERLFPIALGAGTQLESPSLSYGTTKGFGLKIPVTGRWDATQMRLVFGGTTKTRDGRVTLGFRHDWSRRSNLEFGGGYRRKLNTFFYGLGPNSLESDRSFYLRETGWLGASYERGRPRVGFSWIARATYSQVGAFDSEETRGPQLDDVFAGRLPSGYGERSDGLGLTVDLAHDNSAGTGRPNRGGVQRAKLAWFRATDGTDVEFWQYRAEVQQFLPLWHSYRSLAVRGVLSDMELIGNDPIPFQRLMTNDDPDLFRGFQDDRFYGKGLALVNLEYRWPFWVLEKEDGFGVDLLGLLDYGQVFGDYEEISTENMNLSGGFGFRLMTALGLMGRMEFAWSDEGFQFELSADQLFQNDRVSLLRGTNPVPER